MSFIACEYAVSCKTILKKHFYQHKLLSLDKNFIFITFIIDFTKKKNCKLYKS